MNMERRTIKRIVPRTWWSMPAAFLATVMALPVSAGITIPDDPLTTATRIAPNILFILDDSGSMAFNRMPDNVPSTSAPDVSSNAYTRNTLSYNPAVVYQPWMRADGTRMTAGTSYNAVYGSFNLVGGNTVDLADSGSCRRYNQNNGYTTDEYTAGATQVCGGVQTFYVPKDTSRTDAAYLGSGTNYYRYQITSNDVIRSEYGAVSGGTGNATGFPLTNLSRTAGNWLTYTVTVPAGATGLAIATSGGTGDADLYVRYSAAPTTGSYDCRPYQNGNNETCTFSSPSPGTYHIGIHAYSAFTGLTINVTLTSSNRCGTGTSTNDWINCQSNATPTGRSVSAEQANYATWFSYHRTRMKAAKAGASEAFTALDSRVRVGFRTIWDSQRAGIRFDIPVNDGNDGRFVNNTGAVPTTSRSTWFDRLQSVIGYNGTPLHAALDGAGQYFSSSAQGGPYGPQSGSAQYTCRQNFAILTTDGYWNNVGVDVGNQDNLSGGSITGPNSQSFQYSPGAPYRDEYSNTLADVAMKYWKTDLRTESYMTNNVPTTTANPAFWQHMVTFGISIGLSGNKGWKNVAEVPANAAWNDPTDNEDADRIDDLLHAAVNGRGAFVSASNPSEFTAGLSEALAAIAQRTSSYSNVASNSVSLDTGSQVFSASYVSGNWTGQVTARAVSQSGVGAVAWTSSVPAWGSRKIFTSYNGAGVSFPSVTQTAALSRTGGVANYPVTGEDNGKYLRGEVRLEERSGNGGRLRNRTSVLGDIVSSSPAYVKDTNTLYVGANDGMLHAFDASNGQEQFAYVPGILSINDLSTLSRGDYSHKFLVDGPITVSSRSLTPSRNLLIGTLGRGGKGVYSLDVTSPDAGTVTAAGIHNWERAETPRNNMGLVLGKPILAKTQGGSTVAVIGNGINSTNEQAVLIVMDADTGAVIREIETGVGSALAPNGLSAPTGAYELDGKTLKYVFAGDMLGNVWKFDLSNASPALWSATRLFTAQDDGGKAQPISGRVTIATHPLTRKRWIFFGTGRYLTADDASSTSTDVQGMYAVMDEDAAFSRSNLTQRTITVTGATVNGYPVRAFEARSSLPAASKGWYINLPVSGERIVQDAQVVSGFLITASMVPTGNACDADGTGYINALNAFTGTSGLTGYFDLNGNGRTSDDVVGAGSLPVGSVNLGVGMPTLPSLLRGLTVASGTGGNQQGVGSGGALWDRVSWREVRRD